MKQSISSATALLFVVIMLSGCAALSRPEPLTYLSLEKPTGQIENTVHSPVELSFSRGGFYVLNYNFRPAADVGNYVEQAQRQANSKLLTDADVKLSVPFAIDILLFGYNGGTDTVTAKGQSRQ